MLAVLFAMDTVRRAFAGVPPTGQVNALIMLESLAGIVVLRWLMIYGAQHRISGEGADSGWREDLRRFIAGMLLLILPGVGLLAAVFGYMAFVASDDTRCSGRRRVRLWRLYAWFSWPSA